MCPKDVNDYLEKGLYGSPQIKPEEKNKYLGTFRERIYLALTIDEMSQTRTLPLLKTAILSNPGQQLLINGDINFDLQCDYMALAKELDTAFKIVNPDSLITATNIGLVYGTDHAVDVADISLDYLASKNQPASPEKKQPEKTSFFKALWQKISQ